MSVCRMGTSLSLCFLVLVSLFFFVSTREINLSPRRLLANNAVKPPKIIVERPFRFPLICDDGTADCTVPENVHRAGYFRLNRTKTASWMFYYLFEARNNTAKAPVVLWLSGGPGTSASLGVFYENGPFKFNNGNLTLAWNDYGWDQAANMIYVDQPTGTGFSYSDNKADIAKTSEKVADDLFDFLQAFFGKHPEYVKNDFYIAGESYAGHYIPALAARVQLGNKNKQGINIKLKGLAMVSPWTNPGIQYESYPHYAWNMKLINLTQYFDSVTAFSLCRDQIHETCDGIDYNFTACAETYAYCDGILQDYIIQPMGNKSHYDIRRTCDFGPLCYDFSKMKRYLNQASVKKALGVDQSRDFVTWSPAIYGAMLGDQARNLAGYIPQLLQDGIKLLIYTGEYDLECNWLGNIMWVSDMQWSGHKRFWLAPNVRFKVDGVTAGWLKSYELLSFFTVKDAGHVVVMDQPKVALEMLRKWMKT